MFVVGRTSPRGSSGVGSERFIPAAVALTPVLLVHSASLFTLTGRPFAWFDAHAAWGRSAAGVFSLVADHGGYLLEHGVSGYIVGRPYDVLNLLPTILAGALVWPVTRRFGILYGSFLAVNLAAPLLSGSLQSMGRFTSVLFPMFLSGLDPGVSRPRSGVSVTTEPAGAAGDAGGQR